MVGLKVLSNIIIGLNMAGRVERNTTIEGQVAHRVCSRVLATPRAVLWAQPLALFYLYIPGFLAS